MPSDINGFIEFPRFTEGVLLKRYKRFLADVELSSGDVVTAHCPNTGSMKECSEPGKNVWLSFHDNPGRKYKYSWDLIDMGTSLVGVSTLLPNKLVKLSAEKGLIKELLGYDTIKAEVKTSSGNRLDLALYGEAQKACYVEVKNCTYVQNGLACFPDAVSTRGLKHLIELQRLAKEGHRAVMFYLVQRMDATRFEPAHLIHPEYGIELKKASGAGVEILVYDVDLTHDGIRLGGKIPYRL